MSNILDDLEKEKERINIEKDFMIGMIEMIARATGDKSSILLKLSMQIDSIDRKILDYFMSSSNRNENTNDTKIEKAISFYTQIKQLYADLEKELNI